MTSWYWGEERELAAQERAPAGALLRGPGDQQGRWLDLLRGGAFFGNATTELGTAMGEMRTLLTPTGDGFELTGTKYYCTGSIYSDWVHVRRLDARPARWRPCSVPADGSKTTGTASASA